MEEFQLMGSCLGHPFSGLTQKLLTCLDKMKGEASMQQQTAGLYLKAKVREKHPKLFVLLNLLSAGWLLRFFVWFWLIWFGFVFCLFVFNYRQAFQFIFKSSFCILTYLFPSCKVQAKLQVEILSYPSAWESCQNIWLLRTATQDPSFH